MTDEREAWEHRDFQAMLFAPVNAMGQEASFLKTNYTDVFSQQPLPIA